ncbi:MAG: glycosyltransferase family 4 protein [Planctomycetota bacterium]
MRVLFFCELGDPRVGSSTRMMYGLARKLRERGHQTAVVACVRDAAEATPAVVEGMQVFRIHSDYSVRFRPWVSLHNTRIDRALAAILAEWQPDVVHAHLVHTHLGYHSLTQAKRAGAAVVFTAHDVMTFCYQKLTCFHGGEEHGGTLDDIVARPSKCIPCQRLRFRPGRNARIREVLERDVDRVNVVSDELGRLLRANRVPVHATVHNGLDVDRARPATEDVAAFRAKHGLEDAQIVAIGGRLHEQKGVGKLLEMIARLAPDHPRLRMVVMGKRDVYDGEFRPRAEALGIADRVVPTGWLEQDELLSAYAAVDVFATPSLCFDTFGIVNLEAMEQAKPVVATTFGGSKEVIVDGETGFIENPFDVERFAGRIGELLRDPERARTMGEAGRQRLLERFTLDRLADASEAEYGLARAAAG